MAKICFDSINENPEMIEHFVSYFEFWLLRLGGYLPDWSECDVCSIEFSEREPANLQMNFHLMCNRCRRSQTNQTISSEMRQIYIGAQSSSPQKFIEKYGQQTDSITQLSQILKRIINQILNREIVSQKFLVTAQK